MAQDVVKVSPGPVLPKLFAPDKDAARRFIEFFTANIRNPHTQRAYARAAVEFAICCEENDLRELVDIEPVHVAAYIEALQTSGGALGQATPRCDTNAVRLACGGPGCGRQSSKPGVRPEVFPEKGQDSRSVGRGSPQAAGSIDPSSSHVALRDRALIALMVYTFARICAALKMRVDDVYVQKRHSWVRLHEKGGKRHEMPCYHNLETYLHAYIEGTGMGENPKNILPYRPWAYWQTLRSANGTMGRLSHDDQTRT